MGAGEGEGWRGSERELMDGGGGYLEERYGEGGCLVKNSFDMELMTQ